MNLYVWAVLGKIVVIILKKVDYGTMRQHEQRAILTGEVLVEEDSTVNQSEKVIMSDKGKVSDLLIPIITLVVVTLVLMYITGYQALSGDRTLMNIFGEADEALSLFVVGIVSIARSEEHTSE